MEAKLRSVFQLRSIVESLKDLDELMLCCDINGIRSSSLDSCRVSTTEFFLAKSFFESYNCSEEIKFGIKTFLLSHALHTSDSEETVHLKLTPNLLKLQFENQSTGKIRRINTKLLEAEMADVPEQREYESICSLNSSELKKEILNFERCDTVRIQTLVHGIVLTGESQFQSISTIFQNSDANSSVSMEIRSETDKKYGYKYLKNFLKASNCSEFVELRVAEDLICVNYKLDSEGDSYFRFYLASRTEEVEDMEED